MVPSNFILGDYLFEWHLNLNLCSELRRYWARKCGYHRSRFISDLRNKVVSKSYILYRWFSPFFQNRNALSWWIYAVWFQLLDSKRNPFVQSYGIAMTPINASIWKTPTAGAWPRSIEVIWLDYNLCLHFFLLLLEKEKPSRNQTTYRKLVNIFAEEYIKFCDVGMGETRDPLSPCWDSYLKVCDLTWVDLFYRFYNCIL